MQQAATFLFLTPQSKHSERMITVFQIPLLSLHNYIYVFLQNGSDNGCCCVACRSSQPTSAFLVVNIALTLTKPLGQT